VRLLITPTNHGLNENPEFRLSLREERDERRSNPLAFMRLLWSYPSLRRQRCGAQWQKSCC